jgi:hypothetical protein
MFPLDIILYRLAFGVYVVVKANPRPLERVSGDLPTIALYPIAGILIIPSSFYLDFYFKGYKV